MRAVLHIALHDLRLTFNDRGAVIWMLLLPVVFATFFGIVMGGGSSPVNSAVSLSVVDSDGSIVSRTLIEELAGEGVEVDELTAEGRAEKQSLVRTLIIPEGFGEGVLAGKQQTLRLEKEPDTMQDAAMVAQARIVTAAARVIGRLVEASSGSERGTPVPADRFSAVVVPDDLVLVETSIAGNATVVPDGFAQSIPGNSVMFVLLVALTYGAASISSERTSGTLRRLVTAPVSRMEIVGGKIAGRFFVSAVQITILVLVGLVANRALGVFIGDHPFQVWLVLLAFAAAVAPIGVALGGLISDPDRAASVGVILTMTMAALGGCWWPLEVVSKTLKSVALVFPTGWAMRALHGLISFGQTLGEVRNNVFALAGFAILFSLIAARSLRVD